MARIVMKFGGTSVATVERLLNAARHVKREFDAGHEVAVVVSAMADKTDELISLANQISPFRNSSEYDVVVSSGEQVSAGLLALALQNLDVSARSWQAWQMPLRVSGSYGDARILDIDVSGLLMDFSERRIPVVIGFQGIDRDNRIATLGRGGSDVTAVALSAALEADRCDIYTDVDGVYTTDPCMEPRVRRLDRISYEEMLEMAALGAKVLQVRSVELAMLYRVPLLVRSSLEKPDACLSSGLDNVSGTFICAEDNVMEQGVVMGVSYAMDEAWVSFRCRGSWPRTAADVFEPLAMASINLDMIVQNVSEEGKGIDITFTIPSLDLQKTLSVLEKVGQADTLANIKYDTGVAKISVIGIGMRSHAGVAATAFRALADHSIDVRAVGTSEIKISFLIDESRTQQAVQVLHSAFGLDKKQNLLIPMN